MLDFSVPPLSESTDSSLSLTILANGSLNLLHGLPGYSCGSFTSAVTSLDFADSMKGVTVMSRESDDSSLGCSVVSFDFIDYPLRFS